MASIFSNPLVLAETVVGSLLDTRNVVLYKQPPVDLEQLVSANNQVGEQVDANALLNNLIQETQLEELFTGIGVPVISKINGFNMFGVSYLSADVKITSDLCQHPVETGEVITDNAIINPVKATVRISMPTAFYTRIYQQIQDYFNNKKFILLQTKFGMYRNMVITQMPYKLENSSVDRAQIDLELEQVMEVYPQYVVSTATGTNSKNTIQSTSAAVFSDCDTVDLGRITPTEETLSV